MAEADRNDFELMQAVAQGDEEAFRQLVERHQRVVYGTILRMLGDATEAEDLAQRVFLRVYQAAPRYQPTAQFRTWLMTILRNLVFNECQRRSRAKLEPLLPVAEEEGGHPQDWQDSRQASPAEEALRHEREEMIAAAIAELPVPQRLAVMLKAYQDLSYEEIADVLKSTVPATKSLLFRARETLRLKLADFFAL
jgi:RNA polymerase sigma-70 factor, ECF subfamily